MTNPKQPRRSRTGTEQQSSYEVMRRRLIAVGADPDEVGGLLDQWNRFDDDWTAARQAEVFRWDDVRLAEELAAIRYEHAFGTTDDDLADWHLDQAVTLVADGAPADRIMEWVAGIPARAVAAYTAEQGRAGGPRTTLLARLGRIM